MEVMEVIVFIIDSVFKAPKVKTKNKSKKYKFNLSKKSKTKKN